jgi:hypothetical protein
MAGPRPRVYLRQHSTLRPSSGVAGVGLDCGQARAGYGWPPRRGDVPGLPPRGVAVGQHLGGPRSQGLCWVWRMWVWGGGCVSNGDGRHFVCVCHALVLLWRDLYASISQPPLLVWMGWCVLHSPAAGVGPVHIQCPGQPAPRDTDHSGLQVCARRCGPCGHLSRPAPSFIAASPPPPARPLPVFLSSTLSALYCVLHCAGECMFTMTSEGAKVRELVGAMCTSVPCCSPRIHWRPLLSLAHLRLCCCSPNPVPGPMLSHRPSSPTPGAWRLWTSWRCHGVRSCPCSSPSPPSTWWSPQLLPAPSACGTWTLRCGHGALCFAGAWFCVGRSHVRG